MTPKQLSEIKARCEAATGGPWNEGPETMIGHVWVYAGNSPLMQPVSWNGWIGKKLRALKVFGIGLMRSDTLWRHSTETEDDFKVRVYKMERANSSFIAHARKDLPDCTAEIERLQGLLKVAKCPNCDGGAV